MITTIDIKKIRMNLQMSQREFADKFGFSVGALRHWEQGQRIPKGPALVLLSVIARSPEIVRDAIEASAA